MSLRSVAKELRITPAYLSMMVNGKRPWRTDLYQRYSYLVNTSVNTVNDLRRADKGVSSQVKADNEHNVVGRQGFEPWTRGLKVRCSARLS